MGTRRGTAVGPKVRDEALGPLLAAGGPNMKVTVAAPQSIPVSRPIDLEVQIGEVDDGPTWTYDSPPSIPSCLTFPLAGLDSNRLSLLPKRAGGESPVHTL